jgi:hypothetical protein
LNIQTATGNEKKTKFCHEISPAITNSLIGIIERSLIWVSENLKRNASYDNDSALSVIISLISVLVFGDTAKSLCCPSDMLPIVCHEVSNIPPKRILRGVEDDIITADKCLNKKEEKFTEVLYGPPIVQILTSQVTPISIGTKINILKLLSNLLRCQK